MHRYRISVDPGFHTGIALWDADEWDQLVKPVGTHIIKIPKRIDLAREWPGKCEYVTEQFYTLLGSLHQQNVDVQGVFCEMPEFLESEKGLASSRKGDVTHLAYLVGLFSGVCFVKKMPFTPVPVRTWIGQLKKDQVIRRIEKKIGVTYPNHIADAVGLGLYLKKFF